MAEARFCTPHEDDFSLLVEEAVTDTAKARSFGVKATYPDMKRSARLAWGNLLFPFKNPRFGIVPATFYLLTCWLVGSALDVAVPTTPLRALRLTLDAFGDHPGLALWTIGVVMCFLAFTDTHSRTYRAIGGLTHAVAHFVATFYVGWGAVALAERLVPPDGFLRAVTAAGAIFAGGWVVGSLVVGLYLLISLNMFGRHSEEAFSGLRIEDYKHFLRLHIDRRGILTIWPIKIERVPRRWRSRGPADHTASRYVPDARMAVRIDRTADRGAIVSRLFARSVFRLKAEATRQIIFTGSKSRERRVTTLAGAHEWWWRYL